MKRTTRKLLSLVLAAAMCLSLLPASALAEESALPTEPSQAEESPAPTDTPQAEESPAPTDTPQPVESAAPTDTPQPVESAVPTDTSQPVESAVPTDTSQPVESAVPTDTSQPVEDVTPDAVPPEEAPVDLGVMPAAAPELPTSGAVTAGSYTVTGTHTLTGTLTINGAVTITGGGTITPDSSLLSYLFVIPAGATLTLSNITLNGGGTRGTNSKALCHVSGGRLVLNDGAKLTNNKSKDVNAGGVYLATGTMEMNVGSSITDNYSSAVYIGESGALDTGTGSFTMNGGEISGNEGAWGAGGVLVGRGSFTMTGGTIKDNKGGPLDGSQLTGNGANSDILISGGTISHSAPGDKASVSALGGTIKVSGNPVIADNPSGNVVLAAGVTITRVGALTSGANIGVYVADTIDEAHPQRQIVSGAQPGEETYFFSDKKTGADILYKDNGIYLDYALREGAVQPMTPGLDASGYPTLSGLALEPDKYYQLADSASTNKDDAPSGAWVMGSDITDGLFALNAIPSSGAITVWVADDGSGGNAKPFGQASFLYVSSKGNDDSGNGTRGTPYASIDKAYKNIANKAGIIVVLDDLGNQKGLAVSDNAVTIQGEMPGLKVSFNSAGGTYGIFTLDAGAVMTVQNITLTSALNTPRMFEMLGTSKLTLGNGGTITGVDAKDVQGLAVHLVAEATGSFTMEPGSAIKGNTCESPYNPSIVWTQGPTSTFYMKGGEISGNTLTDTNTANGSAGAVDVSYGHVVVSGSPVIYDNMQNGSQSNLYLGEDQTISVEGVLSDGANIGVYTKKSPADTAGTGDVLFATGAAEADVKYFPADKITNAGVIYCTGTTDQPVASTGHTHSNSGDLYLSVAAKLHTTPGLLDGGTPTLTVSPSGTATEYAIMDANGVISAWLPGNGAALELTANSNTFTAPLKAVARAAGDSSGGMPVSNDIPYFYVSNAGSDDTGDGSHGNPYASIEKAVEQIPQKRTGVVVLLSGITKTQSFNSLTAVEIQNRDILLTSERGAYTIAIEGGSASTSSQMHLPDNKNVSLTLQNVVFDGAKHTAGEYGEFFIGSTCTLTLGAGAVLQNFIPRAVNIRAGGTLIMEAGSLITGCEAGYNKRYAGDSYNGTDGAGAAVYVCPAGTFDMRGGEISGNTADGYTGKMDGGPGTALAQTTGKVSGSVAGVYGETGAIFKMSGSPVVNRNTSNKQPANVYLMNNQIIDVGGALGAAADINVYVQNMPGGEGDKVRIAATTVSKNAEYFHSDKVTEAGVGYYPAVGAEGVYLAYDLRATASTSVDPNTGSGVIEVSPTEADTYYSILDEAGAVVSKDSVTASLKDGEGKLTPLDWTENGWVLQDGAAIPQGSAIVFAPVLPGQEYTVVKTKDTSATPEDAKAAGTPVTVPVVSGNVSVTPKGESGKVSILVNPSDPGVKYNVVDPTTKKVVPGSEWQAGNGGTIDLTFPGMDPGKKYEIVAVPNKGADPGADAQFTGDPVTTPGEDLKGVAAGSISRDDGAPEGKDKIVLKPTETTQEYAVVDKATGEVVGGGWQAGTGPEGAALTFDGLDSAGDYQVVTRTPATSDKEASLPTKGVDVPAATVKPGEVALGADSGGKGKITIQNSDPDTKYAVVDKDGNVVAPISNTGGRDNDGWVSGNGGELDISGLPVGGEYTVVTVPKKPGDTDETVSGGNAAGALYPTGKDDALDPVGPAVKVPAVTEDQLSGSIQKGDPSKATVTISPADSDMEYGLVTKNPDGSFSAVTPGGDWRKPDANGKVDFKDLDPEQEYVVVAKPASGSGSGASTTDKGGSGTSIKTPTDKTVDTGKIDRETNSGGGNAGKDKITIQGGGTTNTYDYAVVDKITGEIVAPVDTTGDGTKNDADGWQTGGSGDLTFDGLDPNKEYELVMRPHSDGGIIGVPATPGVTVGKVGAVDVTGIVKDKDNHPVKGAQVSVVVATTDGGTRKLTATTNDNGEYQLEADAGVQLPGDYTLVVESDKGNAAGAVALSKVQPQPSTDVTVDPAVKSLLTGLVTDPATGGPLKDADIVLIDKKTGAPVALPVGTSVVKTDDAGAYVVDASKLPQGDYVIKATGTVGGTDVTGLTEVHVDGTGETTPIKPYKNTNVAPAPGGILSGVVKDKDGKGVAGAEVTLTVPIQDVKPDGSVETIGTKKVTVTTGEDGKYFVPGVPKGDYPVSVTTPDKNVAQDKIAVSGSTGRNDADLTLPDTRPTHANVVSGIVMDKDGLPVKNAAVTIYDKDGNKVATTPATVTTGEGGGWSVEGLDPDKGPFYASVDADGTNGVAGPFEVKADGTVKGGTNVELSGKVTTADGTLTENTEGKLLTGVVKDDGTPATPVSGATVVVTKDGKVVAAATTDANGLYVVPNVPEGATVTVTTPDGSSGTGSLTGNGGANKSDVTVTKPGTDTLVVIGPDGGKLAVKGSGGGADAIVTIKDQDGNTVNGKFTISDGVIKTNKADPNKTPAGTYTVTVEQDGMKVDKTITVGGDGAIKSGAPITVDGHKDRPITGKLDYGSGAIPSDAAIAITGPQGTIWGVSAVDPNDGAYKIPGIPEGTYTATVTVKDPDGAETKLTSQVTVDADGTASYGSWAESGTSTGAAITTGTDGTTLTVAPPAAVETVISAIDTANSENGTLNQVKSAMTGFGSLTTEQKKQVPGGKVNDLSDKLEALLGDSLNIAVNAEGVKNTTEAADQLNAQRGLLAQEAADVAGAKTVDVNLTLVAQDITASAPATDVRNAEAAAKGAEMGAYYDVTIKKTVTVTEGEEQISNVTERVTQVPVPITITLEIPTGIQGHDYYNVIRVHEGAAQRIPSSATKTQITFTSGLYSTYAIVWSDTPIFPGDTKVDEGSNGGSQGGSGGSGGGISSSSGGVAVDKTSGGKVSVSPDSPKEGDKVTISVDPNEGYTLDSLVVKDSAGNELKYVDNGDSTYTFTQPKGKVTISAKFRKVSGDPHDNGVDRLLTVDDHIAFMQGDSAGNFRPTGSVTRAEVAQMFYNLLKDKDVKSAKTFTDVAPDAWYAKAVTALAELGILNGRGDGVFDPSAPITRAEFASIATRFALRTSGTVKFSDVSADHWAYESIGAAAYYGWINGYADGTFNPGADITRSEAAKVVNTMLGRSADKDYVEKNADSLKLFPDVAKDYWAYGDIAEAANTHGFTVNDGVETWTD